MLQIRKLRHRHSLPRIPAIDAWPRWLSAVASRFLPWKCLHDFLRHLECVLFLVVSPTLHLCHRTEVVMQCNKLLPNETGPLAHTQIQPTDTRLEQKNSIDMQVPSKEKGQLRLKDASSLMPSKGSWSAMWRRRCRLDDRLVHSSQELH